MKDKNPQLAKNRPARGAKVYDPSDNSHIRGAARITPILNKQAKNRAIPGQDSLISSEEYGATVYAKDIKRNSPDRPYR